MQALIQTERVGKQFQKQSIEKNFLLISTTSASNGETPELSRKKFDLRYSFWWSRPLISADDGRTHEGRTETATKYGSLSHCSAFFFAHYINSLINGGFLTLIVH